jgi:hypothetical protein
MTPYYTDEKYTFFVDGVEMLMTEEEAEQYQEDHPEADVQAKLEVEPLTLQVDDDIIDCTCDGDYNICSACEDFFRSIQ